MHVNHTFALDAAVRAGGRCLDFGCGEGEVVKAGLEMHLDIWGAENFFCVGHSQRQRVVGSLASRIGEIGPNDEMPFPDRHFDFIFSNQVFEHVANLPRVLLELKRILKPNGTMLHMFPSREVWREGHCWVPLAHRLTGRSAYNYLFAARALGFGFQKEIGPPGQWAQYWADFLKDKCFYRTKTEIIDVFNECGFAVKHDEISYILYRAEKTRKQLLPFIKVAPTVASAAFQRLGGMVLICSQTC